MGDIERRKRFIINAVYLAIIVGIVLLVTRYLLGLVWPFFLAFIFSWMLTPLVRWLTVRCHFRHGIAAVLCLLLFFGIVGGLLLALIFNVVSWAERFVAWLPPFYTDTLEPALRSAAAWAQESVAKLDPEAATVVQSSLGSVVSSVGNAVSSFSLQAVGVVSGWVTKLPGRMLSTLICIIATVFMTLDFHRMTAFLLRQLPEDARHVTVKAKESFVAVLAKYGKSYGIIMSITFVELSIGLLILRQDAAIFLAFLIAVFDIFPVVGAGFVLIPWGIVSLLSGSMAKGLGLLALYVIMTIFRQFIEPRVVGHQVGLHPLVTLIAMLVGTKLFGGIGLLGLPIACAIIKSLDDTGVIHVLRKEEDDRPPAPVPPPEPPEKN